MAFSINRAILLGNLTRDPELRYTQTGKAVLTINMVTNHSIRKSNNMYEDVPTFHRVIIWGKMAEWLSKNLTKGAKVYVDGRISTREYDDKNGNKQRSREIIADNVIPMTQGQTQKTESKADEEFPDMDTPMNEDVDPDDMPF